MIAGGLIPRMTTKPFPRHGVTVQNGRELSALSAVKPLEASRRDGSQIGIDVRGLKPTANINRPSGTGGTSPQNQTSNPLLFSVWFLEVEDWNLFGNWIVEISLPGGREGAESPKARSPGVQAREWSSRTSA